MSSNIINYSTILNNQHNEGTQGYSFEESIHAGFQ